MNALEQLHKIIDESEWDVTNTDDINHAFQEVHDDLSNDKDENSLHFAEIERQAFAFNKSPEKKLSFKFAGDQTLDNGSKIPFEWPDVRTFTIDDFDYLINRFKDTRNTFARAEYGLVIYYAGHLKPNDEVLILLQGLFELAQKYISNLNSNEEGKHYILYLRAVLANALHIAENRKSDQSINAIYKQIIQLIFDIHQTWDVKNEAGLRIAIDFTDFAILYFKDFSLTTNINAFITKNWEFAKNLSQSHAWGAIYVIDISIKLCKKLNLPQTDLLIFKAKQYEKLADNSKQRNNMAAVSFVEKAMGIYKALKDDVNLKRLQETYQQMRTDFSLGEVSQEMPQEESQRIIQHIRTLVKENDEDEIVKTLMFTPMIMPLAKIRLWSEESFKLNLLQNMLPVSIQDKFGNTIAVYSSDEEREKFALLRTYEFHLQIAVQTLQQLFIEALRINKISAEGVIDFLKQTWLSQDNIRRSNGREIPISYLTLLESGILSFFDELHKWNTTPEYLPNLVSATDTLVLKGEYILREFANKIGLPTFKTKPREPDIIMEKTLDDLLQDLEGTLTEDDHFFIKFILTEKAGYNLRNRIAHGLIDNIDYGLEYPLLALVIILKLSNYQFTKQQKEE